MINDQRIYHSTFICGKFRAISIGEICWNENLCIKRITDFQLYACLHAHSRKKKTHTNIHQIRPAAHLYRFHGHTVFSSSSPMPATQNLYLFFRMMDNEMKLGRLNIDYPTGAICIQEFSYSTEIRSILHFEGAAWMSQAYYSQRLVEMQFIQASCSLHAVLAKKIYTQLHRAH